MDDALEAALDAAEETVAEEVDAVLTEVAREFADALWDLSEADELVAARFSVSRIARVWAQRVPRLVRRLLGVSEQAATRAAETAEAELPPEWEDLPGRYDDGRELPPPMSAYVTATEHLLRAVGDRLAEVARAELAAGVDAGEDMEQLRARLLEAFAREGNQLGQAREERIARTEAARAWNAATLGAAQALTGPDRPLVKQWIHRADTRVRPAHRQVQAQLQLLDDPFIVGGHPMQYPGDPTAPPELVIGCRCVLALARADRTAALAPKAAPRMAPTDYGIAAAADGSHLRGSMIALVPSREDAERLAVEGGEAADDLHLTLWFLGDAGADWTEDQRGELIGNLRAAARELGGPVVASAFGVNHWNPGGDNPAWVWGVGDGRPGDSDEDAPTLTQAHDLATYALENTHERPEVPPQFRPWVPHVCAAYSADPGLYGALADRLGPITFDRLRVAFAGDHTDIPLGPQEEPMQQTAAGMPTRAWSTPGDAALAFENQETGDGRIFTPGALSWAGGPWPLQYADEMLMGHDGAELAGAIQDMARDGDRITGAGVLYLSQAAGEDAALLLDEGAPLGVSVDLDDVDLEIVQIQSEQTASDQVSCAVCKGDTTTASAAVDSLSSATSPTPNTASADAAGDSNTSWASNSGSGTRGGSTSPATPGSTGAGYYPPTRVEAAERNSTDGKRGSATTAGATAGQPQTERSDAVTTSPAPTGSRHRKPNGSSLPREDSAPSVPPKSPSSTATAAGTPHTSTTATPASATGRSSASSATQGSETSGTTPNSSNAQPHTCACIRTDEPQAKQLFASAHVPTMRVLSLEDGAVMLSASTAPEWTASTGGALARTRHDVQLITGPGGQITAAAVRDAFASTDVLTLTAAAGDPDDPEAGMVIHKQSSGDLLLRITRARVRGATLVAVPAYAGARIVLEPAGTGDGTEPAAVTAAGSEAHQQVVQYVCSSPVAVRARQVAQALGITMASARSHLVSAAKAGRLVRLAPGLYAGTSTLQEGAEPVTAVAGDTGALEELEASAWTAMRDVDAMPAAWFREPTAEELPPGSGGVHYEDGRIYGWVAQAGEPHAGYPGRNLTIESLGAIDLTHFLRARFALDDGSMVRVGAFTMNAPHDRDGAECENAACQFDDTRTVAGIVTVGMNDRGMWFSGAAAPWLSEWDRAVFKACQPSYHMRQGRDGRWQLRAVLSVPVPGHSSPLLATAVAERANLALAASAAGAALLPDTRPAAPGTDAGQHPALPGTPTGQSPATGPDQRGNLPGAPAGHPPAIDAETLAAALEQGPLLDLLADAMQRREDNRRAEIAALTAAVLGDTPDPDPAPVPAPAAPAVPEGTH